MRILQFFWKLFVRMKHPSCTIHAATLTKNVNFEDHVRVESGCFIGASMIGRYTFIGQDSYVDKSTESIGRFCSVAMGTKISLQNHPMKWVSTHPFSYTKRYGFTDKNIAIEGVTTGKTKIGNDVWIGANVTILAGVTIGDGAVIGADSLVTKNVEPYSIVSGSPAKHVRYRFDEETISKLLKIQWWNWSDNQLRANISFFRDTEEFLRRFKH
jgi:virginiamycin A acetyltransferase